MLDCKENSFLVKEDVQVLHGYTFSGKLAFYKVLLANCRYCFYNLKCFEIQFSLWKIESDFMECFLFILFMKDLRSFSDLVHTIKMSSIKRR